MKDLAFDVSGDLLFDATKQIYFVEGVDKVKQDIIHRLKCIRGTDAFHPNFGLDLLKLKRANYNKTLVEHEIRKALADYKYIKSIDTIEISGPDAERKIKVKLYLTLENEKLVIEVSL